MVRRPRRPSFRWVFSEVGTRVLEQRIHGRLRVVHPQLNRSTPSLTLHVAAVNKHCLTVHRTLFPLQARIVKNWSMVCEDFGAQIRDALLKHNSPQRAAELKELLTAA